MHKNRPETPLINSIQYTTAVSTMKLFTHILLLILCTRRGSNPQPHGWLAVVPAAVPETLHTRNHDKGKLFHKLFVIVFFRIPRFEPRLE